MKAVGYRKNLPIGAPEALEDVELPAPVPGKGDLLVRVHAVSGNPVDTKVRAGTAPAAGQVKVLGWDAVGVVDAVGPQARGFALGDRVWYAGSIDRQGANSELHAVDARIVSRAPRSLSDAQAAALPLTAITAWELLFDRLNIGEGGGEGRTLMIVGGAGGVGSILIQLARQLTNLRVVATASRQESREWCLALGAHAVIDHAKPLSQELRSAGMEQVDYVASLTQTATHYQEIIQSLKPQGALAVIDNMGGLDPMALKSKSLSLHWELMFTRSTFQTPDMHEQGVLLGRVADLVDSGRIRTTANAVLGRISAENLTRAHALIESGKAVGKIVLEGF